MSSNPGDHITLVTLDTLIGELRKEFPFKQEDALFGMDGFLKLDNEFSSAVYESSIYNIARRLVVHAKYVCKHAISGNEAENIAASLERNFNIHQLNSPDRLIKIIYECYKASEKGLPKGVYNQIKRQSEESKSCCYICGVTLTYDDPEKDTHFDAEHVLPRSLGGGNHIGNLKPACKRCNNLKRDRIKNADIHYESMVYPFHKEQDNKITDYHIFAARFFHNSICTECEATAEEVGDLHVVRKSEDDGWNLFNLMLLCTKCAHKLGYNIDAHEQDI